MHVRVYTTTGDRIKKVNFYGNSIEKEQATSVATRK